MDGGETDFLFVAVLFYGGLQKIPIQIPIRILPLQIPIRIPIQIPIRIPIRILPM